MSNHLTPLGRKHFLQGDIAWLTDTIKLAMVTAAYVQSDAHEFFSAVSGVVGTPQALASKTSTAGSGGAGSVLFTSVVSGSTVTGLVLYKDTGTAGTSPILAWFDHNADTTPINIVTNGGNITLLWGSNILFTL